MLIEKAWRTHHNQSLGEIAVELSILKGGEGGALCTLGSLTVGVAA